MLDDEQILERGGDEGEIEEYAKENGADLTKEDFEKEKVIQIAFQPETRESYTKLFLLTNKGNVFFGTPGGNWTDVELPNFNQ
jgi:hypothetical protein